MNNPAAGDAVKYTDVGGTEHSATVDMVRDDQVLDLQVHAQDEPASHARPNVPMSSDGTSQPHTWRQLPADER